MADTIKMIYSVVYFNEDRRHQYRRVSKHSNCFKILRDIVRHIVECRPISDISCEMFYIEKSIEHALCELVGSIARVGDPGLEMLGHCKHSGEYVYEDNINSLRFVQAICKYWPIDNCGKMVN